MRLRRLGRGRGAAQSEARAPESVGTRHRCHYITPHSSDSSFMKLTAGNRQPAAASNTSWEKSCSLPHGCVFKTSCVISKQTKSACKV